MISHHVNPLEKELDELRREFDRTSIERLRAMRDLLDALEHERDNRSLLERLQTHFHAFAGMGGTYGRPRATSLGRRAEKRAAGLLRESANATEKDLAAWRKIVDELTSCFAARTR